MDEPYLKNNVYLWTGLSGNIDHVNVLNGLNEVMKQTNNEFSKITLKFSEKYEPLNNKMVLLTERFTAKAQKEEEAKNRIHSSCSKCEAKERGGWRERGSSVQSGHQDWQQAKCCYLSQCKKHFF